MKAHRRCRTAAARRLAAIIVLAPTYAMTVNAQDRMPPIPEPQMTEAQHAAAEEFKSVRNRTSVGGPFVPLLRSPEVMSRARNVGDYVRYQTALPSRLSEFVILLTARHWTQQYEWYVHAPIAEREGLDPSIIAAVADGRRPDTMSEDEAAAYDFVMELFRTRGVSDPTYARMVDHLGERGVIDTIGIMGYYQLLAMVMNAARTPLPEGVEPALPAFPR